MKELLACWRHTRMIVLLSMCAALYTAALIPFKVFVVIPGIFEIRPAAALPVLLSVFFGPAAAWGAAFGNTIGDFFGSISPGTFWGFLGNFVYAFVPYRVLRIYENSMPRWIALLFGSILASALCATVIALGVDYVQMAPFPVLFGLIFINNTLLSVVLVPLLVPILEKRIQRLKLHYTQVMDPAEISGSKLKMAGPPILFVLVLLIYAVMVTPSLGQELPLKTLELVISLLLPIVALLLL